MADNTNTKNNKKKNQSAHGNRRKKRGKKYSPRAKSEFEERMIDLARVTRVVAGGKRFRFRATVAVGNRKGKVGVGIAKGQDVAQAISKAAFQAKKSTVSVPIVSGTIPHEIKVKYNASVVYLKPAPSGRGINAGGAVRVLCELAGIDDIIGKSISRTTHKLNTARATLRAFEELNASMAARKARKGGGSTKQKDAPATSQQNAPKQEATA